MLVSVGWRRRRKEKENIDNSIYFEIHIFDGFSKWKLLVDLVVIGGK